MCFLKKLLEKQVRGTPLIAVVMMVMMGGCAGGAPIRYRLGQPPVRATPAATQIIVGVFSDERPAQERGEPRQSRWKRSMASDLYTADADFRPEVARQIAQMLAKHLTHDGVCSQATVEALEADLDRHPEATQGLAARGIQLALTGKLAHFTGYQKDMHQAFTMMFGALGVLGEAITNPKTVGGHVEYRTLKIIDVKNDRVLWEGTVRRQFERKEVFYAGPVAYALEALKAAHTDVVGHVNEVSPDTSHQQL